jgi:antitoxin FitA
MTRKTVSDSPVGWVAGPSRHDPSQGTRCFHRLRGARPASGRNALWLRCCYHACMNVAITVRNVPGPVRDELAARAARSGRSLQEYLLAELGAMAERAPVADVIERARSRVDSAGTDVSVIDILAARDADRP